MGWLVVYARESRQERVPALPAYDDEIAAWRAAIAHEKATRLPKGALTVTKKQ